MSADASAYAALGLEPGADAEAIRRAYQILIKRYHPDREGGDPQRAAEINRAYRDLRLAGLVREPLDLQHWDVRPKGQPSVRTAILVLAAAGAVTLVAAPMLSLGAPAELRALSPIHAAEPASERIDDPIAVAFVDRAVQDARRIAYSADEMALAKASRDCQLRLRREPKLAQLDYCAAFDSASVQLLDRDPLRDRGPFSGLAVTGRQMSAAQIFSDDYLAIDSRLDQIRVRVELALAPPEPAPLVNAV